MPLVAHNTLPSFDRLAAEGAKVLSQDAALRQDIRELHIGLLNMMPDSALAATERQFLRLIGASNPIAQFYVHPFTLPALPRSADAQAYIARYYESFEQIRADGLDALIITGANISQPALSQEPFWAPLKAVITWAERNVTSTLCSCLATHAVLEFKYRQTRRRQAAKTWGVYRHRVTDADHPLVSDINTRFDVPHSRWNTVDRRQFHAAGLRILVESDEVGVHLATSADGLRFIFFQGHPEYDTISLLKEFKREALQHQPGAPHCAPVIPDNVFGAYEQAIINEYHDHRHTASTPPDFPEALLRRRLDNTWRDTAHAVLSKWLGLVYQTTHTDRGIPFMPHIDPDNPLQLKAAAPPHSHLG